MRPAPVPEQITSCEQLLRRTQAGGWPKFRAGKSRWTEGYIAVPPTKISEGKEKNTCRNSCVVHSRAGRRGYVVRRYCSPWWSSSWFVLRSIVSASRFVLASRYISRIPVCDGEATSPPGTAWMVRVLFPPLGTPVAGTP